MCYINFFFMSALLLAWYVIVKSLLQCIEKKLTISSFCNQRHYRSSFSFLFLFMLRNYENSRTYRTYLRTPFWAELGHALRKMQWPIGIIRIMQNQWLLLIRMTNTKIVMYYWLVSLLQLFMNIDFLLCKTMVSL